MHIKLLFTHCISIKPIYYRYGGAALQRKVGQYLLDQGLNPKTAYGATGMLDILRNRDSPFSNQNHV